MKKLFIILAATGLIATSCNNESTEKQESTSTTPVTETPENTKTCYLGFMGRDSVTLSVTITGNKVDGHLRYNFYEKDKSQGLITGEMKGDTLIADYSFESEGMKSIRQVVFLKSGDGFTEGYGSMEEKDGRMIVKDRSTLKFGDAFVLKQTECK